MTDKYIEVVKRWRAGEAISVEALRANADAAWVAAWAVAADAAVAASGDDRAAHARATRAAEAARDAAVTAAYAASAAYAKAADAASTDYWLKRHDKLLEE